MADIQYINYGDQQVDQQALLERMADQVDEYVDKQRWTKSRKNKFKQAYSDLISRGIIGAQIETSDPKRAGKWVIRINGDDFNEDNLPKKDREMYQAAAWFIKNQMSYLAQNKKVETVDDKKEEKTPFGSFRNGFIKHVTNQKFGGEKFTTDQWNNFDERDASGIRGTDNRMKMLSELLQSYSDSISDDKFDFADTPYSNASELKGRIQEAITALGTPDKRDDMEKLYALGLDPADWFNNGSGDPSGYVDSEGNPITYGQMYERYKQIAKDFGKKFQMSPQEREKKKIDKKLSFARAIGADWLYNDKGNPKSFNELFAPLPNSLLNTSQNNYNYNTTGLVADGVSMLGDVVSLAGGIPGVVGGATTLVSDIVGDIAKEKPILDVLGHAGANLLWGIAGIFPGVKSGKVIKTANRIWSAAAAYGLTEDEDLKASWNKIFSGNFSNINNRDFENYKWTLHVISGGVNAARGARTDRQVTSRVKNTDRNIKLTDGTTKQLSEQKFAEISRVGRRKGQKAAIEKASGSDYLGKAPAEGQFNFTEKGLKWYNPARWSQKYRDYAGSKWYIPGTSHADIVDLNKVQQLRSSLNERPNWSFRGIWNFDKAPKTEVAYSLNRYLPKDQRLNTLGVGKKYKNQFKTQQEQPNETQVTEFKETLKGQNFGLNDPKNANFDIQGLGNVDFKVDSKGSTLRIRLNNGTIISQKSSALDNVKLDNLRVIKQNLRKINEQLPKEQETKINIELINKLKEIGALKQGGRIDKQKIQKYKEYIQK